MIQETRRSLGNGATLSCSNFRQDGRLQSQPQVQCSESVIYPLPKYLPSPSPFRPQGRSLARGAPRSYSISEAILAGQRGATAGPSLVATPPLDLRGTEVDLFDCLPILPSLSLGPMPPPSFANWNCQNLTQLTQDTQLNTALPGRRAAPVPGHSSLSTS